MLASRLFASCYRRRVLQNLSSLNHINVVSTLRIRHNSSAALAGAKHLSHTIQPLEHPNKEDTLPKLAQTSLEFSSLSDTLSPGTLHALTKDPFQLKHMTQVQEEVFQRMPELAQPHTSHLKNSTARAHDLLVKARTGTGKTLAFLIPAVEQRLRMIEEHAKQAVLEAGLASDQHMESRAVKTYTRRHNGVLILSPTRELAGQIGKDAMALTKNHGFFVHMLIGGENKGPQIRNWKNMRRDITVATPGRLRDLLQTDPEFAAGLARTHMLILDEADTLLDFGFREDIEKIREYLPESPELQTFLFSATVPRSIQQLARSMLTPGYEFIDCVDENAPLIHSSIEQYHTVLPTPGDQIPHLLRLIAHDQLINPRNSKIVLFLPTTRMTQLFTTVINELVSTATPAGKQTRVFDIHSKKSQDQRTRASEAFRMCTAPSILVTTDVSARGVDYPGVTRVIQVGVPSSTDQYVHRVGRTGRAGLTGRADLVLLEWEMGFVSWMLTGQKLKPLTVNQLKDEVLQLSQEHDENPDAFYAKRPQPSPPTASKHRGTRVYKHKDFDGPLVPIMEDVIRNCKDLVGQLDEAAIGETFAALLGYYIPKSEQLRTQKMAIVSGLKTWSTDALGLSAPPYVSASFLHKLGVDEPRKTVRKSRNFGRDNSWTDRGSRRPREASRSGRDRSWEESQDDVDAYKPRQFRRR